MAAKPKIRIQNQGTVTISFNFGDRFVIDTPDGFRQFAMTKIQANRIARNWFKAHVNTDCAGIGTIEWIEGAYNEK